MELTHLIIWKDRKEYSILSSLYDAAEDRSLVHYYLAMPEVLSYLKIFEKQPQSFLDIQKGLDAQLLLKQKCTSQYMKEMILLGSQAVQNRLSKYISLVLSSCYFDRSCYGDGDTVSCYDMDAHSSLKVVRLFAETIEFTIWCETNMILTCLPLLDYFPFQVYKLLYKNGRSFRVILRYFFLIFSDTYDGKYKMYMIFELLYYKPDYVLKILDHVKIRQELFTFINSDFFGEVDEACVLDKARELNCLEDCKQLLEQRELEEETD